MNNEKLHRNIIGALQYLTITRPEISYIVNKLSQFLHCPTDMQWKGCEQVLRYLRRSIDNGLHIQPASRFSLTSFSDADWVSFVDDRRSTSVFCVFLVLTLSHGLHANRKLLQGQAPNKNIEHWLTQQQREPGYKAC